MLSTRETQTTFGRLRPGERCVEFPLRLHDEQLSELNHRATTAQRTIGQMIRQAIGLYLAGVSDRCDGAWYDSPLDVPFDDALTVLVLLPISRLAELEALAAQRDTTASALIRRVVCCFLLECSSGQQLPIDS
jgi:hypothetical protein